MKKIFAFVIIASLFFSACSRKVTRLDPNYQTDLSGRWNDTDYKLVAEEMIKDVLSRPWRNEHFFATNQKPVVIVGLFENKSHEHIEPEILIKDIEKALINSGQIRVVQNALFREKLREERADQGEFASIETQSKWGKELGADFMLFGMITSTVDQYKKEKAVLYKVNMELANLETNEKVWLGDKEIKKLIEN